MNDSHNFFVDKSAVDKVNNIILYDKNGDEIMGKNKFFFLKKVESEKGDKYFLLFDQSKLVDPLGDDTFFRRYNDLTIKKVSKKAGELYLRYLQEKNSRFLILCRRDLND